MTRIAAIAAFLALRLHVLAPEHLAAQRPTGTIDSGTVASGPFQLRYQIEGEGPTALVVGSSRYYPRAFSVNLRKHLRLVFVDHRGFAPSPGPVDTIAFALDTVLGDIERVRQALRLGRIAIVGHSGHALMALDYAKRYPDHVTHVIMIGMAPDLSDRQAAAGVKYWNEFATPERKAVQAENLRQMPDEQLAKLPPSDRFIREYVRNGPRYWYDARFDASPLWKDVQINMDMFNYVWGGLFRRHDVTAGLHSLKAPVYLALGRYDMGIPPSLWDPIRPTFRDLTVDIYERSGHTPQYEEATLFDSRLLAWMNKHR